MLALTPMLQSCEKDKPVDPIVVVDPIDRKTDNPEHKADFMKDVKSKVIGNGAITVNYEAVWVD